MWVQHQIDDVNVSPRVYQRWHEHAGKSIKALKPELKKRNFVVLDEYLIGLPDGTAWLCVNITDVDLKGTWVTILMRIPAGEWLPREKVAQA